MKRLLPFYSEGIFEGFYFAIDRGGDRYRKKHKTKSQLIAEFYRKEELKMPELGTEVREGADDVQLDIAYEITNVEEITTDVQQFSGVRVVLMSAHADEGSVVLWKRKITGKTSKLGVFIEALGSNTDKWLHKWVIFRQWLPRQREIEIVAAPSPRAPRVIPRKVVKAQK